jgi:hypothetical protein
MDVSGREDKVDNARRGEDRKGHIETHDECLRGSDDETGFDMGGEEAEVQELIQETLVVNATVASRKMKRVSKLSLVRKPIIHETGTKNSEKNAIIDAERDITDGHPAWDRGTIVCVVGQQSNKANPDQKCYVFGILGTTVPYESKTLARVMQDGSYRALTNSEFAKGIERMRKEPLAATRCPVKRLQGWLRDKSAQPGIFYAELAQCQQNFQETQQESGTNASTDKTMMTSQGEQLVIEVSSESDDDRTHTQRVHVKSEVQVKVKSSAMAEMQRKLDQMEKKMEALVPRPQERRPKAPQKKNNV